MKKYAKIVCIVFAVAAIAALTAVIAFADMPDLKPGSDTVYFIKDVPEGYTGKGLGRTADDPFIPVDDPDGYDPTAQYPRNYLKTAFVQVIDALKDQGGTIVVCGPVFFGLGQSGGNGTYQKDVKTPVFGDKTIKITSVYNGIDYRETAGAKITISTPAMLNIAGQTIWENIDIETDGTGRCISFGGYDTIVGDGVNCYPSEEDYEGVGQFYVNLTAGPSYETLKNKPTNLLVKSGTYDTICGGNWGVADAHVLENVDANLYLTGTTKVLGAVNGSVGGAANSTFSGNVNITIDGGTYECDIFGGGKSSFVNEDAEVHITINGGTFLDVYSIEEMSLAYRYNPAKLSVLDLSGYKGDYANLEAINAIVGEFTVIKWPDEWEGPKNAPAESETEAVSTDAPETDGETVEETEEETEPVEEPETASPEKKDNVAQKEEGGGFPTWLLIVIVAVAAAAIGAVAMKFMSGKKKDEKDSK